MARRLLPAPTLILLAMLTAVGAAAAQNCTGTITADETMKAEMARYAAPTSNEFAAVYEVTAGGQDRTVPLRPTAIWAKRPGGLEFVSWRSTGIPNQ